jgi:tetratricopeptide (TPR) repeat protein
MRTIGTAKNAQAKIVLLVACYVLTSLVGCARKEDQAQTAQRYVQQADYYYRQAVRLYQGLIAKAKASDQLHFALGQLFYRQGEFKPAIEEFKQVKSNPQTDKLLAVAYYKTGSFTEALEAFRKVKSPDDESWFYYGLTCESLNLYDEALGLYGKIRGQKEFVQRSKERSEMIEKRISPRTLKSIDPQLHKAIAFSPPASAYPEAGALILFCDEEIEINPNGTQDSYLHYVIKILNERGREEFAEAKISYDSTFERIELIYARTIKPDGTFVDVGSRHIRDVSRYLDFPLYSNARAFIISFPEVSEGATIDYKLKVHRSQLINGKDFVLDYPLQSHEPVLKANFTVILPKSLKLSLKIINEKYNSFGANLTPRIEENLYQRIYRWEFKHIPQLNPEPNIPALTEINPTLLLSSFASWKDVYDWWSGLAFDKMQADKSIKEKTRELVKGKNSLGEKVRAIYNYCAKEIRYVAVEYGQAGYQPHAAADIFKNKYGDCKDQAILLVTMLQEAGLSSWPVLIPTREYYNLNPDFPAPLFDHCIAAVELEGKLIFMDPTSRTASFRDLPFVDQARKVLIFKADTLQITDTPLQPRRHNLFVQDTRISIKRDESIQAERKIFTFGQFDQAQRYWLQYTQPEVVRDQLKAKIQDFAIGAKLIYYSIENLQDLNTPVVLTYGFQGQEYFTAAGSLRILPQLSGIETTFTAKDKRSYPLELDFLNTQETYFEITIPEEFIVKYLPANFLQDSPWMKVSVEYRHRHNKIYFRQASELKEGQISESEYPQFKNLLELTAKKIKQRIVLEKKS